MTSPVMSGLALDFLFELVAKQTLSHAINKIIQNSL